MYFFTIRSEQILNNYLIFKRKLFLKVQGIPEGRNQILFYFL